MVLLDPADQVEKPIVILPAFGGRFKKIPLTGLFQVCRRRDKVVGFEFDNGDSAALHVRCAVAELVPDPDSYNRPGNGWVRNYNAYRQSHTDGDN